MTIINETSIAELFQKQVKKYGDRVCVGYKKDGKYQDISWNEMNDMIRSLSSYLMSLGVERGQKIGLFSPNSYEWWVADQAILSIGAINVPIYATNSAEEAQYILENSECQICFVGNKEHMERALEVRESYPMLKNIIVFDELKDLPEGVKTLSGAFNQGKAENRQEEFEKRIRETKSEDLASIMYTSGTTGPPKGVMLTHGNFIANVNQIQADFGELTDENDIGLSFLPLSHSLERTAGYYVSVTVGNPVYFAEDFSKVPENMVEIRPTLIVSVPRLYEKIHSGILAKLGEASPISRALFGWAIKVARENLPYVCSNKERKGFFKFKYNLADRLIFSKLKVALGMDRLKYAVSGGGALSVSDAEFFLGMGIIILEGFGLTETSPVTNVNRPHRIKPGTVGPPLKDTEIKIADDGEILIRGPQVMRGYYKDEAATREVMTEDGFFRTGDLGELDEDNYLKITGRKKEIIVTSGGKNISPQNLENALLGSRYIEQAAIIGEGKKYLSALITPNFEQIKKWADDEGIEYQDIKELVNHEKVTQLYEQAIAKHMKPFSRAEQIRKFRVLPEEWSQETGELTPTLKCKRRVIEEKYSEQIERMYKD